MTNFEIQKPKYTPEERAEIARYFGPKSSSKAASNLMKTDPTKYHRYKEIAKDPELDLAPVTPSVYEVTPGAKRPEGLRRVPDEETVDAISSYSESRIRTMARKKADEHGESFFSVSKNPAEYRKLVLAAKYFDVLPPSTNVPSAHAPTPKQVTDDQALWSVPDDVADALNLRRGEKTTPERLFDLRELAAKKTALNNE